MAIAPIINASVISTGGSQKRSSERCSKYTKRAPRHG